MAGGWGVEKVALDLRAEKIADRAGIGGTCVNWRRQMETKSKTYPDFVIVAHEKSVASEPESGLKRRVLAYNDKLFLAEHEMVKGWVGTVHSHPHEQIVYVVRGHLKVTCAGETVDVRTGDTFVVRGGVKHGASAVEDSLVVDVFTPCREDYIL
jgi:quercetin dioxygenase-like cupin family protein